MASMGPPESNIQSTSPVHASSANTLPSNPPEITTSCARAGQNAAAETLIIKNKKTRTLGRDMRAMPTECGEATDTLVRAASLSVAVDKRMFTHTSSSSSNARAIPLSLVLFLFLLLLLLLLRLLHDVALRAIAQREHLPVPHAAVFVLQMRLKIATSTAEAAQLARNTHATKPHTERGHTRAQVHWLRPPAHPHTHTYRWRLLSS